MRNARLAEENSCLKKRLSDKSKALGDAKVENCSLKQKISKVQFNFRKVKAKKEDAAKSPPTKEVKNQILSEALAPYFTNAQIGCFQKQSWKKVRNWGKEDYKLALTIKMLGKNCYEYLRQLGVLPMPGQSTLRRYFRHFTISPGFLESVAELVKYKLPFMLTEDKVCSITFDEMHLTKCIGIILWANNVQSNKN